MFYYTSTDDVDVIFSFPEKLFSCHPRGKRAKKKVIKIVSVSVYNILSLSLACWLFSSNKLQTTNGEHERRELIDAFNRSVVHKLSGTQSYAIERFFSPALNTEPDRLGPAPGAPIPLANPASPIGQHTLGDLALLLVDRV